MKANRKSDGSRARMAFVVAMTFLSIFSLFSCSSCKDEESPTVQTVSAVLVAPTETQTSASVAVEGKITSTGTSEIISYGFCMSKNPMPTISDIKKDQLEKRVSPFKETFTNLDFGETYYFRAFAMNAEDLSYGQELSIEITAKAAVITKEASSVTIVGATLNGSVNPRSLSGEVWFEYGETANYGTKVVVGTFDNDTIVPISAVITGLAPNKTYYFILKCENALGLSIGRQMTLETYAVADYDGNFYHTVTINGAGFSQTWLRENLKTTHYANGDPISNITDPDAWETLTVGNYCYYNNDPAIGKVYGALYNYYVGVDSRGLINGWHVPTVYQFNDLRRFLGEYYYAGPALMEAGTVHWVTPARPGTNSSGFTALPNGAFAHDPVTLKFVFMNLGEDAVLWTTTEVTPTDAHLMDIDHHNCWMGLEAYYPKNIGNGLRLLKN